MISGSLWNSRSNSRASRIASSRQGRAKLGGVAAGRIALVEDQIDHRGNAGEPLAALHRARRLERHVGVGDAGLGAGDALLHRGFRDQERARDLFHGQARDDAQRQRDLLRRRQIGMAADEQQPQDVVAIMRAVEPLGDRFLGIAEIGDRIVLGQRLLLAASPDVVDRDIAPDHDQPCRGIARRPVLRPAFQRAQAGVLERLLGGIEIAEIAQQRADRLGTRRGQRGIDPGGVGHSLALPLALPPHSRQEHADRADLIGAAGIGLAEIARDGDRLVEVVAVDQIEAEQLFLGLGIGAVEHDRRIFLAQRGRRRGRQQPGDRAEPALLLQFVMHHGEFFHHRGVLFPAPGADKVFIVIAKDGVQHGFRVPVRSRTDEYARSRQQSENFCFSPPPCGEGRRCASFARRTGPSNVAEPSTGRRAKIQ